MNFGYLKIVFFSIIYLLLPSSCQSPEYKEVIVNRFDIEILKYNQYNDLEKSQFNKRFNEVINIYINKIYPDTNITISAKLENFANSNATKYFSKDIAIAYSDISAVQKALSDEAGNFKEIANIDFPRIFTAVIPYNQSILISDSTAIIGLNHYLGKEHPAYEGFPSFQRNFKIKEKIHYDLAEAIIKTNYPFIPKEKTLLERMLYEGIVAIIASEVITDFREDLFFNFSISQFSWCKENETKLWNQLLIDESLYITSESHIAQYLSPAPFTQAFTQQSPGMACRWLGMRIINAYINNCNQTSLECIINSIYQNSQATLINSKYNGK